MIGISKDFLSLFTLLLQGDMSADISVIFSHQTLPSAQQSCCIVYIMQKCSLKCGSAGGCCCSAFHAKCAFKCNKCISLLLLLLLHTTFRVSIQCIQRPVLQRQKANSKGQVGHSHALNIAMHIRGHVIISPDFNIGTIYIV